MECRDTLEPGHHHHRIVGRIVLGEIAQRDIQRVAPGEDESRLIERAVTDADTVEAFDDASQEARFSIAVAGFAQRLRGDAWLADGYDWAAIRDSAAGAVGEDAFGYRAEFLDLVELAEAADEALDKP